MLFKNKSIWDFLCSTSFSQKAISQEHTDWQIAEKFKVIFITVKLVSFHTSLTSQLPIWTFLFCLHIFPTVTLRHWPQKWNQRLVNLLKDDLFLKKVPVLLISKVFTQRTAIHHDEAANRTRFKLAIHNEKK